VIRKRPGNEQKAISSNQPQAKYPTTYSTTYATAKSISGGTRATTKSKPPESNQKATRTHPESNQKLAKYPYTYSITYSTAYSTKYPTSKSIRRRTTATTKINQTNQNAGRKLPYSNQKTTRKQPFVKRSLCRVRVCTPGGSPTPTLRVTSARTKLAV
jgi:hypothetical protein